MCPGCGGNLAETTDKRNAGKWGAELLVCHRCAPVQMKRAAIGKDGKPDYGFLVFSSERKQQ